MAKHGKLSFEANGGSRDEWAGSLKAGTVDRAAGHEIVRTIEYDVTGLYRSRAVRYQKGAD